MKGNSYTLILLYLYTSEWGINEENLHKPNKLIT